MHIFMLNTVNGYEYTRKTCLLPLVVSPHTSYRRPKYISYRCVRIPYAHYQATPEEDEHIVNIYDNWFMFLVAAKKKSKIFTRFFFSLVTWDTFFWCDTGLEKKLALWESSTQIWCSCKFTFTCTVVYFLIYDLIVSKWLACAHAHWASKYTMYIKK